MLGVIFCRFHLRIWHHCTVQFSFGLYSYANTKIKFRWSSLIKYTVRALSGILEFKFTRNGLFFWIEFFSLVNSTNKNFKIFVPWYTDTKYKQDKKHRKKLCVFNFEIFEGIPYSQSGLNYLKYSVFPRNTYQYILGLRKYLEFS